MKKIPGFSRYAIDHFGTVFSLNYKNSKKVKPMKPALSKDGYLKSMFQNDSGKYKTEAVHRLVAITFLGDRPKGMEVNHKNGIKIDNRPTNIEYCTRSQNCQHSFDLGLQKPKIGSLNGMAKITEDQVKEIRDHARSFTGRYYGRVELAKKYGISVSHVKDIVTRRRNIWPHIA